MKRNGLLGIAFALALVATLVPALAYAADVHAIAVCSDRHGNDSSISETMTGMPDDVEYVSMIGDMVGSGRDRTPSFNSSTVRDEVLSVFPGAEMSILWASHDAEVVDDAGVVFAAGEEGVSGVMKMGEPDEAGLPAYYIYGIAFYDMMDADRAASAAAGFKTWVNGVDAHVPILVFCHMPLHYARGDNAGANAWNEALNYAATGLTTTEPGCAVKRNVVFMFGHNHTIESTTGGETGEFYVPCGSSMQVGPAEGVWSSIYYTYTTAGYLNQNATASLVSIDANKVVLAKYERGAVVDGIYDVASKKSGAFANAFDVLGEHVIARVHKVTPLLPAGCTITYTDLTGGQMDSFRPGGVYLRPGRTRVSVTFATDTYTADRLIVKSGDSELLVQKNDPARFGHGASPEMLGTGEGQQTEEACNFTFDMPSSDVTLQVVTKDRTPIDGAELTGIEDGYGYTGEAIEPKPQVTLEGEVLSSRSSYSVSYENNVNAGTATVYVRGIGDYNGSICKTFVIEKADNTLNVEGKTATVSYAKLQKKKVALSRDKVMELGDAQGSITYEKVGGSKAVSVKAKTGKLVVRRGAKKGMHKAKIAVHAAGTDNYKDSSKIVVVKVRVQ